MENRQLLLIFKQNFSKTCANSQPYENTPNTFKYFKYIKYSKNI